MSAVVEERGQRLGGKGKKKNTEALHFLQICTATPRATVLEGYHMFSCQIRVPSPGVQTKGVKLNFISLDSQCWECERCYTYAF